MQKLPDGPITLTPACIAAESELVLRGGEQLRACARTEAWFTGLLHLRVWEAPRL
jgi:hypothetical protein